MANKQKPISNYFQTLNMLSGLRVHPFIIAPSSTDNSPAVLRFPDQQLTWKFCTF